MILHKWLDSKLEVNTVAYCPKNGEFTLCDEDHWHWETYCDIYKIKFKSRYYPILACLLLMWKVNNDKTT